jgi:hypothetical protein
VGQPDRAGGSPVIFSMAAGEEAPSSGARRDVLLGFLKDDVANGVAVGQDKTCFDAVHAKWNYKLCRVLELGASTEIRFILEQVPQCE